MKKILPLAILLLIAQYSSGQNVLRLQHLNVEGGLSQSSVYSIFQDSYGFMWFATGDGLNRYDGKEFIVYKSRLNDTSSARLKDRNINSAMFEDKDNRLWMSTDAGVSFLDLRHGKFKVVLSQYTMAVALDSNSLWSSVNQSGVYRINIRDLQSRFYKFTDRSQTDGTKISVINNGIVTEQGLWMADKAGLMFFNKYTCLYKRMLANDKINSVNLLQNGKLLLCSDDGVYIYDTGKNIAGFIPIKSTSGGAPVKWKSFSEDVSANVVYLGAVNSGTICRLNLVNGKYEFIDFQKSIVYCLFIDRSRNLWVGTEGDGIYKLDIKQPEFSCYAPNLPVGSKNANGLMVKSIYRDDSGKIWIGSYNNGLIKYDPVLQKLTKVPLSFSTANKLISTIGKDSSGAIVITVGSEIFWLDPTSYRELSRVRLPFKLLSSADLPDIYSLSEWKKGHYFVATNIGIYAVTYDRGSHASRAFPIPDADLNVWVYDLFRGKDNIIYIGKRDGYAKARIINDSAVRIVDRGFEQLAIRNFYKSIYTPVLWMATEEGLVAYNENTKQFKVFDETSGLTNSFIYAILAQNDSSLWVSTNHGIANVRVHYNNTVNITADITNYTSLDGLQSNEFNTGAYYQCGDGTLFFGGIAGINWFRPSDIRPNPNKAIPIVSGIFVNDRLFAGDTAAYIKKLDLPYNRSTISFSLRALEFTQQENNRFAYKLEGLDRDWVYTPGDKVRYSNLNPGTYTFMLKVSNNEGVWNEEPRTIEINIQPPYWQTWWFRTFMVIVAAALIYFAVRYYVKQKIRTKMLEFEKQQALNMERMRISKDVHDDLGSGLSKISLMADIAQKRANGNESLGNDIKHISAVSKELVENMRDLIWVLNPENTTLDHLVARLREYCADYLDNIPVAVKLDFPGIVPVMPISREVQRNTFLTVKEAINNCVKHAGAGAIEIVLKFESDKLIVTVSDNGKGFDTAHVKSGGNGLRNMKQRVESIGGNFLITSLPGNTSVNISIPFDRLHAEITTLVL